MKKYRGPYPPSRAQIDAWLALPRDMPMPPLCGAVGVHLGLTMTCAEPPGHGGPHAWACMGATPARPVVVQGELFGEATP